MSDVSTVSPAAVPPPATRRAAPPAPELPPSASLDRRFYALVLDRVLGWGLCAAAAVAAYLWLDLGPGLGLVAGVAMAVWLLLALLLGLTGVSPGGAALGLRVLDAGTGTPIGPARALLRALVVSLATLPTLGLGLASLAWTALNDPSGRRRGWHDLRAGSVVVDVRPAPVEEPVDEQRPRPIVNLTAMRLVPTPDEPVAAPPRSPATAADPLAGPVADPVAAPVANPDSDLAAGAAPRWRVLLDTGESIAVDGLVLVGRSPEGRPGEDVRRLLPLRSADMSVSKTHAQLTVVPGAGLVVMDRGSTNGSLVVRDGVARELPADRPVAVQAGDRIRFGDRTMTVVEGR